MSILAGVQRIVLASASPRRAELLTAAGIDFEAMPAHLDETPHAGESPEAYVRRIADAKARAIVERIQGRIVLGADTTVVAEGNYQAQSGMTWATFVPPPEAAPRKGLPAKKDEPPAAQ